MDLRVISVVLVLYDLQAIPAARPWPTFTEAEKASSSGAFAPGCRSRPPGSPHTQSFLSACTYSVMRHMNATLLRCFEQASSRAKLCKARGLNARSLSSLVVFLDGRHEPSTTTCTYTCGQPAGASLATEQGLHSELSVFRRAGDPPVTCPLATSGGDGALCNMIRRWSCQSFFDFNVQYRSVGC